MFSFQLRLQRAVRIALPMISAVLLSAAQPVQAQVIILEEVVPEPVTFTGSGNGTTPVFPLVKGLTAVSFMHEGPGNFTVTLMNARGAVYCTIYTGEDEVDGSTAFNLSTGEDYKLVVRAKHDWRVSVSQPRKAEAGVTELAGPGPQASPLFALRRGSHAFKLEHDGRRLFQAKLLDRHGYFVQYLIQAVGPFDGITQIMLDDDGKFVIVVEAEPDAEWSILRQY